MAEFIKGLKVLILGNINAVTYKDVFPLIKDKKLWLGTLCNKTLEFKVPEDYKYSREDENGKYGKGPAISWFTNMSTTTKPKKKLVLTKKYDPEKYQKYDNYNAINVDRIKDIPYDYDGVMGVPITFLDKYCPEQFEIVELPNTSIPGVIKNAEGKIGNKITYARILIKKRKKRK